MEEEPNEHDLEDRMYAMIHHVDETEGNLAPSYNDGLNVVESAPTIPRYWHKWHTPCETVSEQEDPTTPSTSNQTPKAKEKRCEANPQPPSGDLSILQSTVPQNYKRTIEIMEQDDEAVELVSSDEDEVIEVALPPKQTITIESSDEEEIDVVNPITPIKAMEKFTASGERDFSASPVPSVISSVSDEFIRSDCIALNISSRNQNNPCFDFSLHGSDLLGQSTPSKLKNKKKSKKAVTSTPAVVAATSKDTPNDECFATPKNKTRNKNKKMKLYAVPDENISSADVDDSDSNQSIYLNRASSSYIVTEKSMPSTDVYDSDSNMSECAKEIPEQMQKNSVMSTAVSVSNNAQDTVLIDLTFNESFEDDQNSNIPENIVMGNVSGLPEYEESGDISMPNGISEFVSTNIPSILNENLDFDNLKGNVSSRPKFSATTLRADMKKFYNDSWGGENFNHREIQKTMSCDKRLWVIDPKDRVPSLAKRKITCNYCNRPGHRDDACRLKPLVCYMCGETGHLEPRCPKKICLNCGVPNQMYSNMCRNCCKWGALWCAECGQKGHPATHCPDIWRRYHNSVDPNSPLSRNYVIKRNSELYCSGCSRRGHLVHDCRVSLPFSGLPINSPYVVNYYPVHFAAAGPAHAAGPAPASGPAPSASPAPPARPAPFASPARSARPAPPAPPAGPAAAASPAPSAAPRRTPTPRYKRQSESPITNETHVNKKRNLSAGAENERRHTKSPAPPKISFSKDAVENDECSDEETTNTVRNDHCNESLETTETEPEFKRISFLTHGKKENIINDGNISSEVTTNETLTSARIYMTKQLTDKLRTEEGKAWWSSTITKHNIELEFTEIEFYSIRGTLANLGAFHAEFRDWNKPQAHDYRPSDDDTQPEQNVWQRLPKNRNNLLRKLSNTFNSLKADHGDPNLLYKELTYLQNRHQKLLKQNVISPEQLDNNRGRINDIITKLNMILIGQAGLANGSEHISHLHSFQEKLMNSRHKTVSNDLRKAIAQHYALIFTAVPRNDYLDLLKMYHNTKQSTVMIRKKVLKLHPKLNGLKIKINGIPTQPIHKFTVNKQNERETAPCSNPHILKKLAFYRQRLKNARPDSRELKKTRAHLVRRLQTYIASINKRVTISSKNKKKLKKLQAQAQLFLSNV